MMQRRYLHSQLKLTLFRYDGKHRTRQVKREEIETKDKLKIRKLPKKLEIPREVIQVGKHIGQGGYGEVKLGYLNKEEQIAIKMIGSDYKKYFDTEIKILRYSLS
jgi:hypothetical protein